MSCSIRMPCRPPTTFHVPNTAAYEYVDTFAHP
jgi:hypothetical protein